MVRSTRALPADHTAMTTFARPSSSPLSASELLWQRFVMLCALGLGSYQLADKSLWVDEAASAGFALGGPAAWMADHNMSLYYMLLGACVRAFGHNELSLRWPSVLCFVATVPLLYRVARASFGVTSARIAIALHVSNAFMLQFAQEARGYMLLVLLVLAAQLALLRLLERPSSLLVTIDGRLSAHFEHTVAITEGGPEIITLLPPEETKENTDSNTTQTG